MTSSVQKHGRRRAPRWARGGEGEREEGEGENERSTGRIYSRGDKAPAVSPLPRLQLFSVALTLMCMRVMLLVQPRLLPRGYFDMEPRSPLFVRSCSSRTFFLFLLSFASCFSHSLFFIFISPSSHERNPQLCERQKKQDRAAGFSFAYYITGVPVKTALLYRLSTAWDTKRIRNGLWTLRALRASCSSYPDGAISLQLGQLVPFHPTHPSHLFIISYFLLFVYFYIGGPRILAYSPSESLIIELCLRLVNNFWQTRLSRLYLKLF